MRNILLGAFLIVFELRHLSSTKIYTKERADYQHRWLLCHYCITSSICVRERKRRSELGICRSDQPSRPISSKTHNPHLTSSACQCHLLHLVCAVDYCGGLETPAVLLVNVPVAFLLHAVLEDHGYAQDEDEVDAHNTKGGSEDLVEVFVGE